MHARPHTSTSALAIRIVSRRIARAGNKNDICAYCESSFGDSLGLERIVVTEITNDDSICPWLED